MELVWRDLVVIRMNFTPVKIGEVFIYYILVIGGLIHFCVLVVFINTYYYHNSVSKSIQNKRKYTKYDKNRMCKPLAKLNAPLSPLPVSSVAFLTPLPSSSLLTLGSLSNIKHVSVT